MKFYEKRGNCENNIKETKYDMNIGSLKMKSFWANEAFFQIMMLVYNIFLLFKINKVPVSEYRQWILTFRLKSTVVFGLKVTVQNIKRFIKYLQGGYKSKYTSAPPNGIPVRSCSGIKCRFGNSSLPKSCRIGIYFNLA